jgi:hypothetical protein
MSGPVFEPRFYEGAAVRHLAVLAGEPIWVNVAWGLNGTPATRPEIDGICRRDGRFVAAEVKAYRVGQQSAERIQAKYRELGFRELIVIAPSFTRSAAACLTRRGQRPAAELITFAPDLEAVRAYYSGGWSATVPDWVHNCLSSGMHHVRFMLTQPTGTGHIVVGQPRSRIYDTEAISRAIARLPAPPARVLWTPQRFTIPRDVIARRSHLTALGGPIPVDIDGDQLHIASHACQLAPGQPGCVHCLAYAVREFARLIDALGPGDWAPVLFSGSRGVHGYLRGDNTDRSRLLNASTAGDIRIDTPVTAVMKATISLPGSLNAASGHAIAPLSRLRTRERITC